MSQKEGSQVTGLTGTHHYNFKTSKVEVKFSNFTAQEVAEILNAEPSVYGFNNWTLDVYRDITGLKFDADSEPEETKDHLCYNLIKIEDGGIYLGDFITGNCKTEATRPTAIDVGTIGLLKKQ